MIVDEQDLIDDLRKDIKRVRDKLNLGNHTIEKIDIFDDDQISPLTADAFQFIVGNRSAKKSAEQLQIEFNQYSRKGEGKWEIEFSDSIFIPDKRNSSETQATLLNQLVHNIINIIRER